MNIFIPFIESYIPSNKIKNVLKEQQFGNVISIQLHDKKIKKDNILQSAKHNYAFVKINLFDSVQGNNMRNNIRYNKTTVVMFDFNKEIVHLQLKPHLSIEDRLERGFELHVPEIPELVENVTETEYDEHEPEWYSDKSSNLFSFDFGKKIYKRLSVNLPALDNFIINKGEMAPRQKKVSFYNNEFEIQELQNDYNDIMRDIELERNEFNNYSSSLLI